MKNAIKFELVRTNFYTRYPCHICGGHTEKIDILCEATAGPFKLTRICENCLEERNFDERLKANIQSARAYADTLETMLGRIEAPTYEEFEAATAKAHEEWKAANPEYKEVWSDAPTGW